MILHTCPHCNNSAMYALDAEGSTHCRSCGQEYTLSQFTRTKPNAFVQTIRSGQQALTRARSSPTTVYVLAGIVTLAIIWIILSIVGVLPDEVRALNRRFVRISDWDRVQKATGLLAIGVPKLNGEIEFFGYGTAWAISNDGFMVTNNHVITGAKLAAVGNDVRIGDMRLWIYVEQERIDAEIVWSDQVADIALLKVDEYVPFRFRMAGSALRVQLNVAVLAIGFQKMPGEVASHVIETELASTSGAVSRLIQDSAGTRWIEHTAPLQSGSSGGPLVLNDRVIGMNTKGEFGVYQALDIGAYRAKLLKAAQNWRDKAEGASE